MNRRHTVILTSSLAVLALGAAACTPAADETAATDDTATRTVVETREVAGPPVVIEREVQSPPIVIERDGQPAGDTTTVRAGRDGIEVETTNR